MSRGLWHQFWHLVILVTEARCCSSLFTECTYLKTCQAVETMYGERSTNQSSSHRTTTEIKPSSNSTNSLFSSKISAVEIEIRRWKSRSSNLTRTENIRILEVYFSLSMRPRPIQTSHSMWSNKREPSLLSASFNSRRDTAFWNTSLVVAILTWLLQSISLWVTESQPTETHFTISTFRGMNITRHSVRLERSSSSMILTNNSHSSDSEPDSTLDADNSTHTASPLTETSATQSVMDSMEF